jgi:hypothetical protein
MRNTPAYLSGASERKKKTSNEMVEWNHKRKLNGSIKWETL